MAMTAPDGKTWEWLNTEVLELTRELAEDMASLPHFEGDPRVDS